MQVYEVRPRKDKRGVNRISDALPFVACPMANGLERTIATDIFRW